MSEIQFFSDLLPLSDISELKSNVYDFEKIKDKRLLNGFFTFVIVILNREVGNEVSKKENIKLFVEMGVNADLNHEDYLYFREKLSKNVNKSIHNYQLLLDFLSQIPERMFKGDDKITLNRLKSSNINLPDNMGDLEYMKNYYIEKEEYIIVEFIQQKMND